MGALVPDRLDVPGQVRVPRQPGRRDGTSAARLQRDEFWPGARQGLTQRESEVLVMMAKGYTNAEIARKSAVPCINGGAHRFTGLRPAGDRDAIGVRRRP